MSSRVRIRPLKYLQACTKSTIYMTLVIILVFQITYLLRSSSPPTPPTPRHIPRLEEAVRLSDELLERLYSELHHPPTNCADFKECNKARRRGLARTCLRDETDLFNYKGTHHTRYYYTYNAEVCSGNEDNLLQSLTFQVTTEQSLQTETDVIKILHIDNPLVRLYEYYQSLRYGLGYLYLGESVVYKTRDFQFGEAWKLPYIYEARLNMLWTRNDSQNPFANPFGPTFKEFMNYLVDSETDKPRTWAPGVTNCHACLRNFDYIVRNEDEVRCLDLGYTPWEYTDRLDHKAKIEIYENFRSLPRWILANLYKTYHPDFVSLQC